MEPSGGHGSGCSAGYLGVLDQAGTAGSDIPADAYRADRAHHTYHLYGDHGWDAGALLWTIHQRQGDKTFGHPQG